MTERVKWRQIVDEMVRDDGIAWSPLIRVVRERDRLAAENAALLAEIHELVSYARAQGPWTGATEPGTSEPRTRLMLAAHAFARAYEAWNEADCGEHVAVPAAQCPACQQEEPLRLAKDAAYEAWRKARDMAERGGDGA